MTRPGFEGGQMPLIRRLPKKGFAAPFKKFYQVVNVESLNTFRDKTTVGPAELKEAGLIGSEQEMIKILGDGKLNKALVIKAHKASGTAMKKITESGSTLELLGRPAQVAAPAKEQPKASPVSKSPEKAKPAAGDGRQSTKQ
jgi:large subunit ribosomal protein L15